jgi:hypothetical protein
MLENMRGILECKCHQENQSQESSSSRPHFDPSFVGPTFHPMQQNFQQNPQLARHGFMTPQHQMTAHPNSYQTPNTGKWAANEPRLL